MLQWIRIKISQHYIITLGKLSLLDQSDNQQSTINLAVKLTIQLIGGTNDSNTIDKVIIWLIVSIGKLNQFQTKWMWI